MKKQWIVAALVMALAMGACLSMPVMAEMLIDDSVDKVTVEATTSEPAQGEEGERKSTLTAQEPVFVLLSDAAKARLEADARKAYQDSFGAEIPADYKPLDMRAYQSDEGNGLTCVLTLMPENWEESADTLSRSERKPYYSIQFGNVNAETGEAELLGVQKFTMYFNEDEVNTPEITEAIQATMEAAARQFAAERGYEAGDMVSSTTVSGSFDPGMSMEFNIAGGKTLTLNVAVDGTVNGYSLVPGKG